MKIQFAGIYEALENGYGVFKVSLPEDVRNLLNLFMVGSSADVEGYVNVLQVLDDGNILTRGTAKRFKVKKTYLQAYSMATSGHASEEVLLRLFKGKEEIDIVFPVENEHEATMIARCIKSAIKAAIDSWIERRRKTIYSFTSSELTDIVKRIEDFELEEKGVVVLEDQDIVGIELNKNFGVAPLADVSEPEGNEEAPFDDENDEDVEVPFDDEDDEEARSEL